MAVAALTIEGMSCDGCARSITNRVTAEAGVQSVTVDRPAGRVDVAYDDAKVSLDRVKEIIETLGFDVVGQV